jgi:hypothetical protein
MCQVKDVGPYAKVLVLHNDALELGGRMSTNQSPRIVFDASRYPAYENAKKKGIRYGRLVMYVSMIGTPMVIALALFLLWAMSAEGLDMPMLIGTFAAIIVSDELLMYYIVGPGMRRRWETPPRVTESEFQLGSRSISVVEIQKVQMFDKAVNIEWKPSASKFSRYLMLTDDELGSGEEFLRAMRDLNPGIEVEDARKKRNP